MKGRHSRPLILLFFEIVKVPKLGIIDWIGHLCMECLIGRSFMLCSWLNWAFLLTVILWMIVDEFSERDWLYKHESPATSPVWQCLFFLFFIKIYTFSTRNSFEMVHIKYIFHYFWNIDFISNLTALKMSCGWLRVWYRRGTAVWIFPEEFD